MSSQSERVTHPGNFIRDHVIPPGMTVGKAAEQLGVSRQALSRLLNGKSALSHQMALKLERAFGADHEQLLDAQAKFDRDADRRKGDIIAPNVYIPTFVTIKANEIHAWADSSSDARQLLPVLVRKLIHSTGQDLSRVDFSGYDLADRRGWDGVVESGGATPWIPPGKSCWELSTQADPSVKATSDYRARVKSVPAAERKRTSFVFVTTRNWPKKRDWAAKNDNAGDWQGVRAYDASDIEQWMEGSIAASIWFAERLNVPLSGLQTHESWWDEWRSASDPPMIPDIFASAINEHKSTYTSWLSNDPKEPLLVTADSIDEALAFLACLFTDRNIDEGARHSGIIFRSADLLRKLVDTQSPFVPIVYSHECQSVLASTCRSRHCIFVRPRNATNSQPDIRLTPLDHSSFDRALVAMGFKRTRVVELARVSGRSLTILRRRLSRTLSINTPQWADTEDSTRTLIPMALVGTWDEGSSADRKVLEDLAEVSYSRIEKAIAKLLAVDDSPVWSEAKKRGVISQIDAIFTISMQITTNDLESFFRIAKYVLSERDPALDLPETERWMAALYGKERIHSAAIRRGICESLVILSVYGNGLFRDRLGMNLEDRISTLIKDILSPLSTTTLRSNNGELPLYAEAAPEVFMRLIEQDLRRPRPVIFDTLVPYEESIFTPCPRTGILWALECLAWKNLGRINKVLAKLSKFPIYDCYANTPMNSLKAIYRAFMPQTSAALEQRIAALRTLIDQFPAVGWQICMHQLSADCLIGTDSYRPLWRDDARGHGEPIDSCDKNDFRRTAIDFALNWQGYSAEMLCDLMQYFQVLEPQDQISVLTVIDAWADSECDEDAKYRVRELIRSLATSPSTSKLGQCAELKNIAQAAYLKLQPIYSTLKYKELFNSNSIGSDSDDNRENPAVDVGLDGPNHTVLERQYMAIKDVLKRNGILGIVELASVTGSPSVIHQHLTLCGMHENSKLDLLEQYLALQNQVPDEKLDQCVRDFLHVLDEDTRISIVSSIVNCSERSRVDQIFRCAPFKKSTWMMLEMQDRDVRDGYWSQVSPVLTPSAEQHLNEVIGNLLSVRRPYAAFDIALPRLDRLDTADLKRVLLGMAATEPESDESYAVEVYYMVKAFEVLDRRMDLDTSEMAHLEFPYVRILTDSERGIPGLANMVANAPEFFVQLLAWCCRRKDSFSDPPEWCVEDPVRRDFLASAATVILDTVNRAPSRDVSGKIDFDPLLDWVNQARRLCATYSRGDIGDQYIGQLLARISFEEKGEWPCIAVCQVLETVEALHVDTGFHVATMNRRGAHLRAGGGRDERELATHYHRCAQDISITFPHASEVVEGIARDYEEHAVWLDQETRADLRRID